VLFTKPSTEAFNSVGTSGGPEVRQPAHFRATDQGDSPQFAWSPRNSSAMDQWHCPRGESRCSNREDGGMADEDGYRFVVPESLPELMRSPATKGEDERAPRSGRRTAQCRVVPASGPGI
jgi:hypothetical protein